METKSMEELLDIKRKFISKKIRICHIGCDEQDDVRYAGKEGIVNRVDDLGQLHGTWGGIALNPDEDDIKLIPTGQGKIYHFSYNIGKVKYIINYHDGYKRHNDGSEFYDIATFSNKKKMEEFEKKLVAQGYEEKPFRWNE